MYLKLDIKQLQLISAKHKLDKKAYTVNYVKDNSSCSVSSKKLPELFYVTNLGIFFTLKICPVRKY